MTDVVPLHDPEAVVAGVASKVGGLTNEEYALVYGAAVARRATDPDGGVAVATLHSAGQVLMLLRRQRCAWCGQALGEHAIDLAPEGCRVTCRRDERALSADDWIPGPRQQSSGYRVAAVLGWVGLPLLSVGLLSWVMPLAAAIARHRRSWAIAAAVLLVLAMVGALVPNDDWGGFLLVLAWWGGTIYGAFQVLPWLRSAPLRQRVRTAAQPYPPGG